MLHYQKILLLIFVSCLKLAPVKLPAVSDSHEVIPVYHQTKTEKIPLNDSECLLGGVKTTSWTDQKIADGIYTEGQDTDYQEEVICFYASTVAATSTKPGDFKIIATDISVGDSDCPQGGKKYESFIDVDGNNVYSSTVDTNYSAKKICNGLNGTASLSGANGVIITTTLASGSTQCPGGGTKLESFTDLNANGTYESGVDSFYNVKYTCNGSNSVTITSTIASGDATCPSGGTLINTFTDINNNGIYDSTIDKNSNTYKVCNGQKALVLSTTLASGDTTCPAGGTQYTTCIDSNGDSNCTSGPDLNYATQKICNGPGAGFLVFTENAGSNCRAGGYRLDRFQDNNNNAVYDVSVDTGYTSTYICNGLNWLSKSTLFTAGNGTAGDNTACPVGGARFEFGYDHVNSSNGSYNIGIDGVLDTVEIVASATTYSCNGSHGVAGPLISKFQNDSEGSKARFNWEIITADGAAPTVKIGYSATKAGIQAWNCESSLAGVTVVTDFANCTDTTYRTSASGSLTSNAICGFDLAIAPFSTSAWDYRYFKICAQNSTSPYSQNLSTFRVAGNVPAGMVMVHQDDWPIHEFANTTITPFTYAIDKWENYLSSGSITNGTPGVCTSTNCVSSSTGVLSSATAQSPQVNIDWYASRKGCANRTAAGYTGANTLRTIHLTTELENFVANYGTPDEEMTTWGSNPFGHISTSSPGYLRCNINMRHNYADSTLDGNEWFPTGDVGTKDCISRYGARDMIGNMGEILDGYYENLLSTTTRQVSQYWGTADRVTKVISNAVLGYSLTVTGGSTYVQDWDYQNLLPKTTTAIYQVTAKFFKDAFTFAANATGVVSQDTGYNWGTYLGRFNKSLGLLSTFTNTGYGARCAITSP
jgi:hypothetical protein